MTYQLDFSNPEHRNFYMDCYGGEEYLKDNFPTVYKAVWHTAQLAEHQEIKCDISPFAGQPVTKKISTFNSLDAETDADDCVVNAKAEVWFHPNSQIGKVSIAGWLQSVDSQKSQIYDAANRTFFYPKDPSAGVPERVSLALGAPAAVVKKQKRAALVSVCTVKSSNAQNLTLSVATRTSAEGFVDGYSDSVESIEVLHPRSSKEPPNNPIKVMYGNRVNTSADYAYRDLSYKENEKIMVYVPMELKITMKDGYDPLHASSSTTYPPTLEYKGVGIAEYSNSTATITHEGNVITAKFPDPWKCEVKSEVFKSGCSAVLHCAFFYTVKDPDFGGETDQPFIMLSDSKATEYYKVSNNTQVCIPELRYEWGCFAKGTLIFMADGSRKCIEKIEPGDLVEKFENGAVCVRNVFGGTDKKLVHFETVDGITLRVTAMHLVLTTRGMLQACEICIGDSLIAKGGSECPLRFLYEEDYDDAVYNLSFDEPASIYAEGIVCGDQESKDRFQSAPPLLNEESQQFMREMDELEQLFFPSELDQNKIVP